jgi:hypothetical protein
MKKTKIGTVYLKYNPDGTASEAKFNPEEFYAETIGVAEELQNCRPDSPDKAISDAERVISQWFVKLNGIELSDREGARIEREVIECEKREGGGPPLRCVVALFFVED